MSLIINRSLSHVNLAVQCETESVVVAVITTLVSSKSILAALAPRVIANCMDPRLASLRALRICNSSLAKVLLFSPATLRFAQALNFFLEDEPLEKLQSSFVSKFKNTQYAIEYGKTIMEIINIVERPQLFSIHSTVITDILYQLSPSSNIFFEQIAPSNFQFLHTFILHMDPSPSFDDAELHRPLTEEDFKLLGAVFGRHQSLQHLIVNIFSQQPDEILDWTIEHLVKPVASRLKTIRLFFEKSLNAKQFEFIGENCLLLEDFQCRCTGEDEEKMEFPVNTSNCIPFVSNLRLLKNFVIENFIWTDELLELASNNLVSLEELNLRYQNQITPQAFEKFLPNFKNLKLFGLYSCANLSSSSTFVNVFLKNPENFPHLNMLDVSFKKATRRRKKKKINKKLMEK